MLDIKLIRNDAKNLEKKLKTKIEDVNLSPITSIDDEARKIQTEVEKLKAQKNKVSKEIGYKKQKGEDVAQTLKTMSDIGQDISKLDEELKKLDEKRLDLLARLPNIPQDDIPVSLDPQDNKCIKTYKEKPKFDFQFKNHIQLNEKLKLFDFVSGVKIAGNRWVMYTDMGAKLEWALLNYMLDIHRQNGFTQIIPPLLVKEDIMFGSGQLPKFKDQLFNINDEDYNLYLIPTAEVPLNGINQDEIIPEENLPKKYVAYTPCFRREAGAAGKQERGLIRTHQFNKVELFYVTTPEDSNKAFDIMLNSAEEVLKGLDLHYRNMLLCTGDMSFPAAKTVDVEVFLPGQDRYYEVSSVSNCTDFQSRRSKIRCRKKDEKPRLIHTLNASGVATSRLMVALLENNQQEDGSVVIPVVLRKYLNDQKLIKPNP